MSGFTNQLWDYYVAVITIVSVVGCGVFLMMQGKHRIKPTSTDGGGPDTSGHVWDGDLQEFQNPMPRWWIILFYLTILFGLVYLALFPGLGERFEGLLHWTSVGQFKNEMQVADARYAPLFDSYLKQDLAKVAGDQHAQQIGERIFLNNCAPCHGSDAHGSKGFPNLTTGHWKWGGTPDAIETTITGGRDAQMPPLAEAIGGADAVADVANYVLSLSDSAHDSVRAARGKDKFATCAACHGADGKGNPALGSADFTSKNWLYGGSLATISETVTKGRHGVMPAWKGVLTPAEIHLVAAYVYSLSPHTTAAAAPITTAAK